MLLKLACFAARMFVVAFGLTKLGTWNTAIQVLLPPRVSVSVDYPSGIYVVRSYRIGSKRPGSDHTKPHQNKLGAHRNSKMRKGGLCCLLVFFPERGPERLGGV